MQRVALLNEFRNLEQDPWGNTLIDRLRYSLAFPFSGLLMDDCNRLQKSFLEKLNCWAKVTVFGLCRMQEDGRKLNYPTQQAVGKLVL
jgi:hypothetical protein